MSLLNKIKIPYQRVIALSHNKFIRDSINIAKLFTPTAWAGFMAGSYASVLLFIAHSSIMSLCLLIDFSYHYSNEQELAFKMERDINELVSMRKYISGKLVFYCGVLSLILCMPVVFGFHDLFFYLTLGINLIWRYIDGENLKRFTN